MFASFSKLFHKLSRLYSSDLFTDLGLGMIVGVIAGLGAAIFRWLINDFQSIFFQDGAQLLSFLGEYYVIIIPAAGGLLVGPLVYFLARETKGHGVPEVMEAVAIEGGRIRPRVALVKSIASSICIGSGGSVGREGPIVQIGSSLGSTIGQLLKLPEGKIKTLIACGAAGGISATFNAPIAGVFFALEVIIGRIVLPRFAPILISSVIADLLAHALLGKQRAFIVPKFGIASFWEIGFYAILGVAAAFVAVAFIKALYGCEDLFKRLRFPEYFKPAIGGIVIGLIGLYNSDLFGVGYGGIDEALSGQLAFGTLLLFTILKITATSVTIGSGGSGGVFAPSLFIGAMLGAAFGILFNSLFSTITGPIGAYGIVGMAAVFAGASRAPLTAILILFELTGDYGIILPLMTAVTISTVIARKLSPETIYTLKLLRRGIDIHQREIADVMSLITVGEAMTRDFPTVSPNMPVTELLEFLHSTGHHGFPIVDEEGMLFGVVTLSDVEQNMKKGGSKLAVEDIAVKDPLVVYPDQTLHEVLESEPKEFGRIPVVDRNNRKRLLGVLRRHDIIRLYRKKLEELKLEEII